MHSASTIHGEFTSFTTITSKLGFLTPKLTQGTISQQPLCRESHHAEDLKIRVVVAYGRQRFKGVFQ